jgi:hypothetical protein
MHQQPTTGRIEIEIDAVGGRCKRVDRAGFGQIGAYWSMATGLPTADGNRGPLAFVVSGATGSSECALPRSS